MMNTTESFKISDILRAVASALNIPVVIILIILLLATVAMVGWIVAEFFTERRHLKVALPRLLDAIRDASAPLEETIASSGLLKSQKEILLEITRHPRFTVNMREALAVRLIDAEQGKYDRIVKLSEIIARLGPMFGLLGTLIPLGPGIIALGRGDTYTLSTSLLTAFDTTIAGLSAAAVASVISAVRRSWYKEYMSILEVLSECVLEQLADTADRTV